jgi:hypothetical protein
MRSSSPFRVTCLAQPILLDLIILIVLILAETVRAYRRKGPDVWAAVGLQGGPLSLVSATEDLLERRSSGSGPEIRECGRGDPWRWHQVRRRAAAARAEAGNPLRPAASSATAKERTRGLNASAVASKRSVRSSWVSTRLFARNRNGGEFHCGRQLTDKLDGQVPLLACMTALTRRLHARPPAEPEMLVRVPYSRGLSDGNASGPECQSHEIGASAAERREQLRKISTWRWS